MADERVCDSDGDCAGKVETNAALKSPLLCFKFVMRWSKAMIFPQYERVSACIRLYQYPSFEQPKGSRTLPLEEFISSPVFRYGIFPLVSAIAGILLKCATRNDQYAFFKKEDMAVGPQLMLTAALTFVAVSTDRAHSLVLANKELRIALEASQIDRSQVRSLQENATQLSQKLMGSAWLLLTLIILLWGITTLIKRWGWKTESELHPVRGIGIPLAAGVLSLATVMTVVQP